MNKAIARLKDQAAKLGAGWDLAGKARVISRPARVGTGSRHGYSHRALGCWHRSWSLSWRIFIKSANGLAIYVPPE